MKNEHQIARDLQKRHPRETKAAGLEAEMLKRGSLQPSPGPNDASQLDDATAVADLLASQDPTAGGNGPVETPLESALEDQEDRGDEGDTTL